MGNDEEFVKFCIDKLREHIVNTDLSEAEEIALDFAMELMMDAYVAELQRTQDHMDHLKRTGMMN